MEAKVYYIAIWVYTFLEHILFCFCVRYKVLSVYCTLSQTEKYSIKKEDFRLKSDITWQNPIFEIMEAKVYYNTIWVYTSLEHIFVFLCEVHGV